MLLFRASDRLYGTTKKRFLVLRCTNCGLARLDPPPAEHELAQYYPQRYWFRPEPSLAGRLEEAYRRLILLDHVRFVERALRHSKAPGPLLDVGSGGGLLIGLLRRRGHRAIGFDNSPQAATVSWTHNHAPAICGDFTRAPLAPESCGAISMFHVVEHLPDPPAFLRAARELLHPEGRLIVQVPNIDCWQFRWLGAAWNGVDVPRHLFNFRARDLVRLLRACGFEVVRTKHFSWRDNPAGLATSLAPWLDPVARRVRSLDQSSPVSLLKDVAYFALTACSIPFAALEATFRHGASIMVEARKTSRVGFSLRPASSRPPHDPGL